MILKSWIECDLVRKNSIRKSPPKKNKTSPKTPLLIVRKSIQNPIDMATRFVLFVAFFRIVPSRWRVTSWTSLNVTPTSPISRLMRSWKIVTWILRLSYMSRVGFILQWKGWLKRDVFLCTVFWKRGVCVCVCALSIFRCVHVFVQKERQLVHNLVQI